MPRSCSWAAWATTDSSSWAWRDSTTTVGRTVSARASTGASPSWRLAAATGRNPTTWARRSGASVELVVELEPVAVVGDQQHTVALRAGRVVRGQPGAGHRPRDDDERAAEEHGPGQQRVTDDELGERDDGDRRTHADQRSTPRLAPAPAHVGQPDAVRRDQQRGDVDQRPRHAERGGEVVPVGLCVEPPEAEHGRADARGEEHATERTHLL